MGKKGEGTKKYKLVVKEKPWGCKVQYRKWSSQRMYMPDPWTRTMVWDCLRESGGRWVEGAKGENLDNCNSINNKI